MSHLRLWESGRADVSPQSTSRVARVRISKNSSTSNVNKKLTNQMYRVLDPLTDDVLFAGMFKAHQEVIYAALLLSRDLVREDVYASINLHGIRIDDTCALELAISLVS